MSERVQTFPFYTISGGAYERGVQYGTLARDRVKKSIEIYGGALDAFGLSAAAYARLVGDFAKKVAEFDEQYLEEMRASPRELTSTSMTWCSLMPVLKLLQWRGLKRAPRIQMNWTTDALAPSSFLKRQRAEI